MKIRWSSWAMAVAYTLCGIGIYRAAKGFTEIYNHLLGPNPVLPRLTALVLAVHPLSWLLLSLVGVIVVLKDFTPGVSDTPKNWPFGLALVAIVGIAVVGLFYPLTIIHIGPAS